MQNLGLASYWKDPYNMEKYYESANALPDLDNERVFNEQFKTNLLSLDKIVMFASPNDGMISPWQSSWFATFQNNSDIDIIEYKDREVYK